MQFQSFYDFVGSYWINDAKITQVSMRKNELEELWGENPEEQELATIINQYNYDVDELVKLVQGDIEVASADIKKLCNVVSWAVMGDVTSNIARERQDYKNEKNELEKKLAESEKILEYLNKILDTLKQMPIPSNS